jgi:hypothetical protein
MGMKAPKDNNPGPIWSWRPDTKTIDGAPGVGPLENDKEYSIILWDARYRENLIALECLSRQTIRDKTNFIFLEWTDKPNPEVLKYDFIDVYCMNLPKDLSVFPAYDAGIQLNLALYLANTEWLTYLHCDIISDNQLEMIHNKSKKVNDDIIYMEGYAINARGRGKHRHESMDEFKRLVGKYGSRINPYKYKDFGKFVSRPHQNGILLTARKNKFIKTVGGFMWNHPNQHEVWCGIGCGQERLGKAGLRGWLLRRKMALVGQQDMAVYTIPHGRERRDKVKHIHLRGGPKYYDDFVRDWLPRHKITHYQVSK